MKALIIGLLVLGNISAFAQDSEFERGFAEGKATCREAKESWICTLSQTKLCNDGNSGTGRTRNEAILNIYGPCLEKNLNAGKKPVCQKL